MLPADTLCRERRVPNLYKPNQEQSGPQHFCAGRLAELRLHTELKPVTESKLLLESCALLAV